MSDELSEEEDRSSGAFTSFVNKIGVINALFIIFAVIVFSVVLYPAIKMCGE